MKIFRALFRPKDKAPEPPPECAPAPMPSSAVRYYAGDLELVRTSPSLELLRQYSAHHSGYVREAVLRRCVELALPELLPVVAERLNDWVPQVQRVARMALTTLLPVAPAAKVLGVMPVILRLHSAGRGDHTDWLEQFEQSLLQAVTIDDICLTASGSDIKVARASVHLLDKHKLLDTAALITLILKRNDDIVLAQRAVELCARLDRELQDTFYRAAARSHFGAVRTSALRLLLTAEGEAQEQLAISALLDTQSSVRQIAINYLLASGVDVRAHYRGLLLRETLTARHVRVCLTALAALRDAGDIELVQSFQSSEYPSVRLVARAAWFKLNESEKDDIALAAMHDPAVGVRKLAILLVRKHGAYIPFSTICAALEAGGDAACLLQLVAGSKWNWLECLARFGLARGVDAAHKLGVDDALHTWLCSTQWHEQPGKEQVLFLLSEPVAVFFRQLLERSPQRLALLRRYLDQYAPQLT